MSKAHLTCHPGADAPFHVAAATGERSFKTFAGAMRHAVKMAKASVKRKVRKVRKIGKVRCAPIFSADDTGLRRFKIEGKRENVTIGRTIQARSKRQAASIFQHRSGLVALTVRMLKVAIVDGKSARSKRSKAVLSSRRRAQRSANETRVLRAAGMLG